MTESKLSDDKLYGVDDDELVKVRSRKAWTTNPNHFRKMKISPSAIIKMMTHAQSGVEKGIKKSGKPIEIMGLLLGRPDTDDDTCAIISDAQPLPIEGFETRVIADDESTINYMIELGEVNELTRKERFCGWYHTHPFDVEEYSNSYLSNTDISTQLQWQRAEDPHGNPWFAIVIDPLRSIAKNKPELKAFRVYPPDYNPPINQTPDGTYCSDDKIRIAKWGVCWNRYYEIEISYYMSTLSQQTLGTLKNNFLWQAPFTSSSHIEIENQHREREKMKSLIDVLSVTNTNDKNSSSGIMGQVQVHEYMMDVSSSSSSSSAAVAVSGSSSDGRRKSDKDSSMQTTAMCVDIASERCRCNISQLIKYSLFCRQLKSSPASSSTEITTMDISGNVTHSDEIVGTSNTSGDTKLNMEI